MSGAVATRRRYLSPAGLSILGTGFQTGTANEGHMVLSALLLVSIAVATCALGIRVTLNLLGLDLLQTLLWLGVVEVPAPPAPRRRAPALVS